MNKSFLLALILMLPFCCASAQGKRVVFIGDSITDGNWGCPYNFKPISAERNHTDMNHIYGHSYVMLIASDWQSRHPKSGYSFFNRGFSGHKLSDLAGRWQEDVLDIHPDVLSVLVGVNDMGNAFSKGEADSFDFDSWKRTYGGLLQRVRQQDPSVKLVLCTPFLAREGSTGNLPDYEAREAFVHRLAAIVRELSKEYGAVCIPFDNLFEKLLVSEPEPCYWIWDGVHPTPAGLRRMADLWKKKVKL